MAGAGVPPARARDDSVHGELRVPSTINTDRFTAQHYRHQLSGERAEPSPRSRLVAAANSPGGESHCATGAFIDECILISKDQGGTRCELEEKHYEGNSGTQGRVDGRRARGGCG